MRFILLFALAGCSSTVEQDQRLAVLEAENLILTSQVDEMSKAASNGETFYEESLKGAAFAESQYEKIKGLAGEWCLVDGSELGKEMSSKGEEVFATYEFHSSTDNVSGSVTATFFVGQKKEVVTSYYVDSGQGGNTGKRILAMRHFGSLGDYPPNIYMAAQPDGSGSIAFAFDNDRNMKGIVDDLHFSSHSLELHSDSEITAHWTSAKGQEPGMTSTYRLKRIR